MMFMMDVDGIVYNFECGAIYREAVCCGDKYEMKGEELWGRSFELKKLSVKARTGK